MIAKSVIISGLPQPLLVIIFAYFRSMKQLFFIFLIFITNSSIAQSGWKQRVDTRIDVRLDDRKHMLHAFEEMTYTNNSPDTLRFIYIHLWPNAYKNDHTPMARQMDVNKNTNFYYAKPKDRGYIDSLQFTIDGHSVDHYSTESAPDIARIDLDKPLPPHHSIKIATPFKVKIPKVFSRMGHTGQAYYISQWFPKPAVYDSKGWHPISYLDQGEFYSEYGSYDVNITLPANYVLMATGNCMDEKEERAMDELSKMPLPGDTLYTHSVPASTPETKTVHYHEDNVHDFAWFADKRWIVRKDTVTSPGNGKLVTTWSAFLPYQQKSWIKANDHLKATVLHYGQWIGPYQYKTIKAVSGDLNAGGGMEYPTITIIDKGSSNNLSTVVVHEAGHNWFYGMLGSNERDHAWMDEGINTFYEQKTNAALKADTSHKNKSKKKIDESIIYYEMASIDNDQAIEQTSANFNKLNYGLDIYYKTALMLNWLEQYIGKENFESGMKEYFDKWHFDHPYPEDFKLCMTRHTPKSLDWFFDNMLYTTKRIDMTITKVEIEDNKTNVTIRNNTGVLGPVLIDAYKGDSIVATAWSDPFRQTATIFIPTTEWDRLKIDDVVPDCKTANDVYRRGRIFHHFGLKLNPVLGLNIAEKDKLFISPAIGNNEYDGIMLGLLFHDLTMPENRFKFALTPMYGLNSGAPVGAGSIGYSWYPRNFLKEVLFQVDGKRFHNNSSSLNITSPVFSSYTKIAPSLTFTFREKDPLKAVTRSLLIKGYNITEETIGFSTISYAPSPAIAPYVSAPVSSKYALVRYMHSNTRAYNPFGYSIEAHGNGDFAKISAEGNVRIDYNTKNRSLYVRGFIGKYIPVTNTTAVTSRYELNTSYSGMNDYLYDGTYFGRNAVNGSAAHQVSIQEGGFKVPLYNSVNRSDNWMATINLKTDLPLWKLPIRLFLDAGLIPNATPSPKNSGSTTMLYDGGVELWLSKDIVSVYFPIIMSNDIQNYIVNTYGRKNLYTRSISFTFHLQNINWLKLPSKLINTAVK